MYEFFETFLWKYQCGFQQGFNTQNVLLFMVKRDVISPWQKRSLWSHIDYIYHDLLTAKCLWIWSKCAYDFLSGISQKTKCSPRIHISVCSFQHKVMWSIALNLPILQITPILTYTVKVTMTYQQIWNNNRNIIWLVL